LVSIVKLDERNGRMTSKIEGYLKKGAYFVIVGGHLVEKKESSECWEEGVWVDSFEEKQDFTERRSPCG
jgi:hypothetical protein